MMHLDIDTLTSTEATKDAMFKNTIGNGVCEGTTSEELFLNCHRFREIYKQPAIFDISNARATTDSVYVPDQYKWNNNQNYAIEKLMGKYAFVEVTDCEALELRIESLNSLSQGAAVLKVLRTKLDKHCRENPTDDGKVLPHPDIVEAVYCAVNKTTLYFFSIL